MNDPTNSPDLASTTLIGFAPSDLLASYPNWAKCSETAEQHLCPETKAWLCEWRLWDLACSPMNDDDRRRIRYGHYLGWHVALVVVPMKKP